MIISTVLPFDGKAKRQGKRFRQECPYLETVEKENM